MMLPAREFPEEDPSRADLESAAGTPAESPADSGRGADAAKVAQADTGAQADSGMPRDNTVQANSEVPPDKAVSADADMAAYGPPLAIAVSPEAGRSAGTDAVANVGTPAGPLFPARGDSAAATAGREWSDVLAMFVDDPHGSVAEASAMVDEAINALIAAARGRQASLAASWQAQEADTEQLRMALQDYRTFWTSVTQLPQSA